MMIKNRISLFVATFLVIGFFFLALPEKGYSGVPLDPPTGCCELEEGPGCFNVRSSSCISRPPSIGPFVGAFCNERTGLCEVPPEPIPTLSEWGLIAMAGILGIVGFMVIRRRKVTA